MKMTTLAVSLISAGIATLITAKVVEKQLLAEFDERMEKELAASVNFLEQTGRAEPTEDYENQHKMLFGTKFDATKPSVEDLVNKHQKVRYDQIVRREGYSPEGAVQAEDGSLMTGEVQEEAAEVEMLSDIHAITLEEFMENESGFLQSTLNYFDDGGVLDEDGDLVVGHVDMIGEGEPPFGELSGETHIVYLRNTKIRREFEVVKEEGNAADILQAPGSGEVT